MSLFIIGQEISDVYYYGTTGIADGSFSKNLFFNGVSSGVTVTASSAGGGYYTVAFTPDAEGIWSLRIAGSASSNPAEGEYYVSDDLMTTRKHVKNRIVIDKSAGTYVLYEDDKLATFETGTATESATEIERSPD